MTRQLFVVADDFGIGPETSRGLIELGSEGLLTAAVALVNSPYIDGAIPAWKAAGKPLLLGWHPCLTMDGPVSPPESVPSLVDDRGRFWTLGDFLKRLLFGRIQPGDLERELAAQYRRCVELLGGPPSIVNGHHHIHAFGAVNRVLLKLLKDRMPKPFVRRVREPWRTIVRVKGVRAKRLFLSVTGRSSVHRQVAEGFPGADWHLGITDPPFVGDPNFFANWLKYAPGDAVELMVHPGHFDGTLAGRDGEAGDGSAERRVRELERLRDPNFRRAVAAAGFEIQRLG